MTIDYEKAFEQWEKDCAKDDVGFDGIVNFFNQKRRMLFLDEIDTGVGSMVDSLIRFYNIMDEENNIPIESREPIKIYINSPGGLLTETFTMIDAIKMSKTPVWGIVTGTAYSGGFFTLLACHKRLAYPHASFLFHEGATETGGTSGQFENYAAFYKRELGKLKELVLDRTNITEEEYNTIKRDDIWYDTEEAITKGIINEIVTEII